MARPYHMPSKFNTPSISSQFTGCSAFSAINLFMDLSFARLQRARQKGRPGSPQLSTLLAEISSRQSVSPTAKAQMVAENPHYAGLSCHPEIAQFAGQDAAETSASTVASFNPEVAATIVTQIQSS